MNQSFVSVRDSRPVAGVLLLVVWVLYAGMPLSHPAEAVSPATAHHVTYHGGRLLHSPDVYAVYWLPRGYHFDRSSAGDARYINSSEHYLRWIGGTRYLDVLAQYSPPRSPISGSIHFRSAFVDRSTPFPHHPSAKDPMHDSDLGKEFEAVASARGWGARNTHANQVFILFIPTRTYLCRFAGWKTCDYQARRATTIQCGFHTYFIDYGPLAVVTDPSGNDLCFHSGLSSEVKDPYAASAVETLDHELVESITDPFFDGWRGHTAGDEIADLCLDSEHSGTKVELHGHPYFLGKIWSNRDGRCVSG